MIEFWSNLGPAVINTLLISAASFALGAALAVPLLMGRIAPFLVISWSAQAVIDVLRGIPPIVCLFLVFFGITVGGSTLSPVLAAIVGLGLISAGYLAEIFRGALAAVPSGQFEASAALGLHRATLTRRVIAPQVVRIALPTTASYSIGLLKDSAIASTIGAADVLFHATATARATGDGVLPFVAALAIYLALSFPLAFASRRWERHLQVHA